MLFLALYVLDAMVSWVPENVHSYYEKGSETDARYVSIAIAVSETALDPNQEPVFDGDEGRVKTALLLASIASLESGYNKSVVNCKVTGDHGLALGPWQTHSSRKKSCNGNLASAATVALDMSRQSFDACKYLPIPYRLSIYTTGKCCNNWHSNQRVSRALNWFDKHQPEIVENNDEQYTAQYQ